MPLTDQLAPYCKCDEASGSPTLFDAVSTQIAFFNGGAGGIAPGKINNARDLVRANNESYFGTANILSPFKVPANTTFTFTCWVQLRSKPAGQNQYIAVKNAGSAGSLEWALLYRDFASTDRFHMALGSNFAVGVNADNLGSPALDTWYFIVCWHDTTGQTINIQVNNGTVNSQATGGTLPVYSQFGQSTIGAFGDFDPAFCWDGLIDEIGFWTRVLTAQERTDLWGNGAGFAYPFIAVALQPQNHDGQGRPPNP